MGVAAISAPPALPDVPDAADELHLDDEHDEQQELALDDIV